MVVSQTFEGSKLNLSTVVRDDYVLTTVQGHEVYSLVDKESGRMTLAAFESKVAANRFFANNGGYHVTKIL